MAKSLASPILQMIRSVFEDQRVRQLSDQDLLKQFSDRRDEAAFHAILYRHGGMVLEVCRGVLGNETDAEDAFQATFLVLASKAASIRKMASVASWLHGVAVRTALKARGQLARRQKSEARVPARQIAEPDDLTWREVRHVLHEELTRLPERYRLPLIVCYLEGRTQADAAAQLGMASSTLKERLERGRSLLRARLIRRGLGPVAVLFATAWPALNASACLPATLVDSTIKAALFVAAGGAAASIVPAKVAALSAGVLHAMFARQLKLVAAFLLLLGALSTGAWVIVAEGIGPQSQAEQPAAHDAGKRTSVLEPGVIQQAGKDEPRTDGLGDPLPDGALGRLGSSRFRVGHLTNALAFSPRGDLLAAIGYRVQNDSCLWLFDAATGRLVHQVAVSDWSVAFSPDGKWLVTNNSLAVIEVATGKEVRRLANPDKYHHLVAVCSPDGRTVAAGAPAQNGAIIMLWDIATGKELRRLECPAVGATNSILSAPHQWIAFAPDGKTLAAGGADRRARLWDVATGKEVRRFTGDTQGRVQFVAFTRNNKVFVSAGEDWVIRLWDVQTGQPLRQLKGDMAMMRVVALSPDRKLLASAGRVGAIHLWDVDTGKELRQWQAHRYDVNSLTFSPDSMVLASVAQGDPAIRRWDMTGKEIDAVAGHTGRIDQLRFAADGMTLLSSGRDSKVREWDLRTGRQRSRLFGGPMGPTVKGWGARADDLAADGKLLALLGDWWVDNPHHDPLIRLCDTTTGREIRTIAGHGAEDVGKTIRLSPDGRVLASASGYDLRLWDVATGVQLAQLRGDAPLGFSADSRLLAFAAPDAVSGEDQIHVWNVDVRKELRRLNWSSQSPYLERLAFSPDGKSIAAAGAGRTPGCDIRVWAIDTGKEVMRATGVGSETEGELMINALTVSPSGRMLAFGGSRQSRKADGMATCTMQVLEVFSGQEIRRFDAAQGAIWSLAFAPDGRTLASGGGDSTILLWDLTGRVTDGKSKAPHAPSAGELDALWSELAGAPAQADRALWALVLAPTQSVPSLKDRLRIVAAPPEQIAKLVAGLGSDNFTTRENAAQTLERLGASAEQTVRKVLHGDVALEVRRRLEKYLDRRDTEVLRTLRAIEALELIATPQARQVLETLGKSVPNPRAAQAAADAVHRFEKRGIAHP